MADMAYSDWKVATIPLSKFEEQDLPKILAALHTAHEGKQLARVIIDFAADGGVLSVQLESKRKFK